MDAHYRAYLQLLDVCRETDVTPPLSDEAIAELTIEPILAVITLREQDPELVSLCVGVAPSRELPDLIIRRDLTPFSEPYQMPIGVLSGGRAERSTIGTLLAVSLAETNGAAAPFCRPLVSEWPSAVMICEGLADQVERVGPAFMAGAIRAGLPREEVAELCDRWDAMTSKNVVFLAVQRLTRSWRTAVQRSDSMPNVGLGEFQEWFGAFVRSWRRTAGGEAEVGGGR